MTRVKKYKTFFALTHLQLTPVHKEDLVKDQVASYVVLLYVGGKTVV